MVTFAPENAPALKFTVSWLWCEILHKSQGSLALCFYQENFHSPVHASPQLQCYLRAWESMGDFFLLNLRKTPGGRWNAALRFVSKHAFIWRASKLHSSKSYTAFVLTQLLVYFCESFSSLEIELRKVPSVFFPRGTLQYQTSSEWLKLSVACGLCHKHDSAGFSLHR